MFLQNLENETKADVQTLFPRVAVRYLRATNLQQANLKKLESMILVLNYNNFDYGFYDVQSLRVLILNQCNGCIPHCFF